VNRRATHVKEIEQKIASLFGRTGGRTTPATILAHPQLDRDRGGSYFLQAADSAI
jgi:hypothetical protein